MRAIPVLVVLVWTYFAFPLLAGTSVDAFTAATVALGFHLGAYVAETIRAGLTSVRPGQMRAALALGMSTSQAIRTIILPQALIRMLPNLGSLLVIAIKDSAIASVVAVPELMRQSQILAGRTYRPFEIYTVAMLVYFCLCYPVARGVDRVYRRLGLAGLFVTFDWSVVTITCRLLLQGAGVTVVLTVVTMALAVPGGLLLAGLRLSPSAPVRGLATAIRRILPRDAADPAALLDVLRPAGLLRRPALGLGHRDRRPRLQRVGLQFRDLSQRDPCRSVPASGTPAVPWA